MTLPVETHTLECRDCKRKILVEIALIGVSHTAGISTICAVCLKRKGLDKKYAKSHPEDAGKIEKWLEDVKIE